MIEIWLNAFALMNAALHSEFAVLGAGAAGVLMGGVAMDYLPVRRKPAPDPGE
ncbi:hypothetical protein [Bailinhaonella thermotolerans]|uniref:hypothetical protein n=1 Tax=Bailinhaonella thermotolerans TaxID=1070861 RepID=UPI00192A4D3C|nr:hypothetical protein [Bailinhaonella thermotolerans]